MIRTNFMPKSVEIAAEQKFILLVELMLWLCPCGGSTVVKPFEFNVIVSVEVHSVLVGKLVRDKYMQSTLWIANIKFSDLRYAKAL